MGTLKSLPDFCICVVVEGVKVRMVTEILINFTRESSLSVCRVGKKSSLSLNSASLLCTRASSMWLYSWKFTSGAHGIVVGEVAHPGKALPGHGRTRRASGSTRWCWTARCFSTHILSCKQT